VTVVRSLSTPFMNETFFRCHTATLACLVVLPFLASCKRLGERVEITETREISQYEAQPKLFAYSQQRFSNDPLSWETPAGWVQAERSQMRPINLKFGPNGEGECYLSMLPGGAGGTVANVNRWRKQMGQPDLPEAEVNQLPKRVLMGIEGVFVSLDGAYTNVGSAEALPEQRLMGVVAALGEVGLFVKMVGPKELVAANQVAFDQFVNSLRLRLPNGAAR
jgi:hypothetical protein